MHDSATDLETDGAAFGPLLRRLRLAARLSQEQLAERARLSVVSVSALERGRRRAPYRETLRLLGDALQLSEDQREELESLAKRRRPGAAGETGETGDESVWADLAPPAVSPQSGATARHNLPVPRTRLIGRDGDVAAVVAMLRDHRLVTLVGTGGIGKTRTALAVGDVLLGNAPAGVWFIDLAPLARGSLVAGAAAHALGVKESPECPLIETLVAYLKHKDTVLIFDNCEHVVEEVATLADQLLRECERVKLLATSRERLRLNGEQAYRLPPLRVPARGAITHLHAGDAVEYSALMLFVERAQGVDRRFVLDEKNTPTVAEICRLLDGIALAIELAAARVNILPPAALLAKLDQRFRILTGGERSALPRHQTMLALIDWSYDLLAPREQRLFEQLSVFAGGCDLTEASVVCGDDDEDEFAVLDVLMSLVEKSLVMAEANGRDVRYRLLESSRIYAARKLSERDDVGRIARCHSVAYLRLAEHLERERQVAPDAEWLARAEPELENWRAALISNFGPGGDVELGQRLVSALRPVWTTLGLAEGRRWLDVALRRVTEDTPADVVGKLHFAAANITFAFGEYAAALAQSVPLIERFRATGDAFTAAYAEYLAGGSLVSMGRVTEGQPLLERALEVARAQGSVRLTGLLLEDIGYGKSLGPHPAQARVYIAEALEIWTMIGAKRNEANSATVLAENLFLSGEVETAIDLSVQAIAKLRELGFTRNLVVALNNLAAYFTAAGRFEEARFVAREALENALEMQATVALAWSLQHLAAAAVHTQGDATRTATAYETAGRLLGYVDARLVELGSPRTLPEQREYERMRSALRAALVADVFDGLMTEGAALTFERAVELGRSL